MKPKAAIANKADSAVGVSNEICLHCGQVATFVSLEAEKREAFCCQGCQRVYHFLGSQRLDGYYQILSRLQRHAPSQASDLPGSGAEIEDGAFRYGLAGNEFAFFVPDVSCAACLWLIQKVLREVEGVDALRINLENKLVIVTCKSAQPPLEVVVARLASLGYRALPPRLATDEAAQTTESHRQLVDLGVAGAAFGNVMLFAAAVYFGDAWGMTPGFALFFNLISLVIATATIMTSGRVFFKNAWVAVRIRSLHVDLPIALALLLSYGVSVANLYRGSSLVYFDSITGLIFLLLCGRYLSETLARRARTLAGAASSLVPLAGRDLKPGDVAVVKAGDLVPADGIVLAGMTEISETALTGEAAPVIKRSGDRVFAGSHNVVAVFTLKVERAGAETYVESIRELVARATSERSGIETLAGAALSWFLGGVILAALAAGVIWGLKDPARVVEVMTATLIVSCPCALALATPLTMAFSLQRSWRHGVIIKTGDAVERCACVDTIVIDKTGTLTTGHLNVIASSEPSLPDHLREGLIRLAATSRHPVSQALGRSGLRPEDRSLDFSLQVLNSREFPGQGLAGRLKFGGDETEWQVHIGATDWIHSFAVRVGLEDSLQVKVREVGLHSRQLVAALFAPVAPGGLGAVVAVFGLQDPLRAEAAAVVAGWRRAGLVVELLSGDAILPTRETAAAAGVAPERVYWRQTPEGKVEHVRELQRRGHRVMMIGDGVNDAAALATAYLGVAVRGGVDLALSAADVFLGTPGLTSIEEFRAYSRYTTRTLVGLLGLAAFYNVAAVSLALSGMIHPLVAALIMPVASLSVIAAAFFRQGEHLWKSSISSCPLPSSLPASASLSLSGQSTVDNMMT